MCIALEDYGLSAMPLDNLPKSSTLQPLLRRSRRRVERGCLPWVSGDLHKVFEPMWHANDSTLRRPEPGNSFTSFAHFASCWWSRALTLCTAQADARAESATFEWVLRRFLDLCRVAQEEGVFVAYEYDKREWEQITTRIESKDRRVDPNQIFERLDTDTRHDVKEMVARVKAAPKR